MLFFAIWLLLTPASCAEERRKRVLNGVPVIVRNTGYNAVRYYAAIGTRHGIPKYKPLHSAHQAILPWYLLLLNKKVVEGLFLCSGALMTPGIIQTACHCVSTWQKASSGYFRLPKVSNHWETTLVVYVGANRRFDTADSMENVTPLESRKFFIHRNCARYREGFQTNIYDFGWISVNKDWLSGSTGVPIHAVDFTPMYTTGELKNSYRRALKKELVCLRLGFGHFKLMASGDKEFSGILRHGWGVVRSLVGCYRVLTGNVTYEYSALEATWICSLLFPKHNQSSGEGDSGGPVSCDNSYIAVVQSSLSMYSFEKTEKGLKPILEPMSIDEPIYFALYENAIEYRQDFEDYIADFGEGLSYVDRIRDKLKNFTQRQIFHDEFLTASFSIGYTSAAFSLFVYSLLFVAVCIYYIPS